MRRHDWFKEGICLLWSSCGNYIDICNMIHFVGIYFFISEKLQLLCAPNKMKSRNKK